MLPPNLYARVRLCHVHWHARPRVRQAPGLHCALFQVEGNEIAKPRVKHAARSRKHAHIIASAATQSMPPFHASPCGPDGLLRLRLIVYLVIFSSWLLPSKHFRCLGTLPSRRAVWQPAHTLGLTASRSQKSRTVHRLAANACGTFIGDNQSINPCVYQLYRTPPRSAPASFVVSCLWR